MADGAVLLLGSTDLTAAIADHLVGSGVVVAGVVSPPPAFRISYAAGGVRNTRHVDMAAWCDTHRVPFTPYAVPEDIATAAADGRATAALVAGWYHHVPKAIRDAFRYGCVGVHASLLPRYRGGAPLTWAMLNGETEAGVSLFQLGDGIDDGPLFAQRSVPIADRDYVEDVINAIETVTLAMLADVLPAILDGTARPQPQRGTPSYGLQRGPDDGAIDWHRPASAIARLVRSVSRPYPGARTWLGTMPLTIWRARVAADAPVVYGVPGQIARVPDVSQPAVVTGDGLLLVEEVEGDGGFDLAAFARCHQQRLGRHA